MRLKHVKTVKTRGKEYHYFNTGQRDDKGNVVYTRLPDPASASFFSTYAALKAGRTKRENVRQLLTVSKLIELYQKSDKFNSLAPNTQKVYIISLRKIDLYFGEAPADDLTASDVTLYMDEHSETPGAVNLVKAVIGAMYKWARKRGHATIRPVEDVDKLTIAEHEPWPAELLERGLVADNPRVRLAVNLLYFTGQRIGDAVNMRWADIKDGHIHVVQQKTGKELAVPIHSRLQAELDRTPRIGFNIITRWTGAPIGPQPIRIAIKKFAGEYVPHGLRKNAVIALLEAGCSENEVGGITGQSPQMVRHYAKRINQKTLGGAAILKWEKRG